MAELYKRKALILAKIEAAYGIDASPDGAHAINVTDLKIEPAKGNKKMRGLMTPDLATQSGIITEKHQAVSFTMELKGAGAAGDVPECGVLLRSCMMAETITPATQVEYDPISSSFESSTIYVNMDGVLHKLTGCRGTFSVNIQAGEFPTIKFSLLGLHAGPVSANPVTPVYLDVAPLEVNSVHTTFSLDGYDASLHKLTFDAGIKHKYRELVNASAAISVSGRECKGSLSMDAVELGSKDYFASWENSVLVVLAFSHGQAGNLILIDGPKVQLDDIQYGDDDGVLTYEMPVSFTRDAGDDEIKLTFK